MDYKKKFEDFLNKMQGLLDSAKKQGHIIVRVEDIENTFPELKESEDESVRKELINIMNLSYDCGIAITKENRDRYIAWLEKQGVKQSLPIPNERAWLYLVADVLTWENGIGQYLDDPRVQQLANELGSEYAQKLYTFPVSSDIENNRQETDGKAEQKFHEGDWIVYNNDICQIVKREEGCNKLVTVFGIEKELVNERNLSTARLWAIEDAKEGDVLVDEDNNIGLYREEKDDLDDWESYIYLGCDNRLYGFSMGGYHNIKNTKPATKEQSDLLFQKIKEKGYKWDAEKKALKEIELHDSDKIEPKFKVGEWA